MSLGKPDLWVALGLLAVCLALTLILTKPGAQLAASHGLRGSGGEALAAKWPAGAVDAESVVAAVSAIERAGALLAGRLECSIMPATRSMVDEAIASTMEQMQEAASPTTRGTEGRLAQLNAELAALQKGHYIVADLTGPQGVPRNAVVIWSELLRGLGPDVIDLKIKWYVLAGAAETAKFPTLFTIHDGHGEACQLK